MRHRISLVAAAVAITIVPLAISALPATALPAGALDPTFGADGIVAVDLSDPAPKPPCIGSVVFRCGLPGEGVVDAVGRPDGSVVVVTPFADTFLALTRFTPTGQLDTTFGTGGFTAIGPSAGLTGIATAADAAGRLYVSWTDDPHVTGATFRLTRLRADGTVDTTFGSGGTITHPDLQRWVVTADGHVLLHRLDEVPFSAATVTVTRLTETGQVDPTYGSGGTAVLALPALSPEGMLIQHDIDVAAGPGGSFVLATKAVTIDRPFPASRIVLGRLTATGSPDPTLGPGGLAFPMGPASRPTLYELDPTALAVGADGTIVVGGQRTRAPYGSALNVVRFLPSGVPDPAFGNPGYPGLAVVELVPGPVTDGVGYEWLTWLGLDAAGRPVLVGDNGDPTRGPTAGRRTVLRLTAAGAPDPAFGIGGRTTLPTELVPAGRTFAITGDADVVGGGSVASPDRVCGSAPNTYACPDLLLFELRGT